MAKRNDDTLAKKWSQPRVVRDELTPWVDPGVNCSNDPGLTDQSQAEACDINVILKRFQATGVAPGINAEALYADVSNAVDYHQAMDVLNLANEQFNALDAHTRARFNNDPAAFLDFMHDEKNLPDMIKLGLAKAPSKTSLDRIVDAVEGLKHGSEGSPTPSPASSS